MIRITDTITGKTHTVHDTSRGDIAEIIRSWFPDPTTGMDRIFDTLQTAIDRGGMELIDGLCASLAIYIDWAAK